MPLFVQFFKSRNFYTSFINQSYSRLVTIALRKYRIISHAWNQRVEFTPRFISFHTYVQDMPKERRNRLYIPLAFSRIITCTCCPKTLILYQDIKSYNQSTREFNMYFNVNNPFPTFRRRFVRIQTNQYYKLILLVILSCINPNLFKHDLRELWTVRTSFKTGPYPRPNSTHNITIFASQFSSFNYDDNNTFTTLLMRLSELFQHHIYSYNNPQTISIST